MNSAPRFRPSVAAALFLLASFAPLPGRAEETALLPETILRRIEYLASDALRGRGSGEKGNEKAARYLADAFRAAGLKPVGTSKQGDPAARLDGSGYFQPFRFPAGAARGRDNRLQASWEGRTTRYRLGTEFEPFALSGSGAASGEMVFVGAGAKDEDYAGVEVRGKIVLLLAGAGNASIDIPGKAGLARGKGAAAVLAIPAADGALRFEAEAASADVGIPALLVRRSVADTWLQASGTSLAEAEKTPTPRATSVRLALAASVQRVAKVTANVVGLLEGSDPALRDEIVVIGAHMDHLGMGGAHSLAEDRKPAIHHGADDNASGTAGVVALAEHFARQTSRPKRSVLFLCFSGEELGLLGSAHYVKSPLWPLEKTAAMLNMDMIGRMKENRLSVIGAGTGSTWSALLDDLSRDGGLTLSRDEGGFGGSDHQSFYAAKVPVLFFFTGLHADYHRPSDTAEKINAAGAAQVVALVGRAAARIADSPERPAYVQVAAPAAPGRMRARVSLGTIPEYGAGVVGVLLGGVRPGSPAEKAGLQAGDILIEFGGRAIRNIEEYTFALGQFQPGDVVKIVVRRKEQTLTLTATLAESRR